MSVLPQVIYIFKAIIIKIPSDFMYLKKLISNNVEMQRDKNSQDTKKKTRSKDLFY